MTRGHLLPSLRRSPPPLHGAPRDQVRCLTQLTAGSQVTQGEVTRGASPPHTLLEAAQPRARPPRSLSLPGRKELRPQPQVHPGLFQGQLLSVPGEVPAAQRGPLLTTTGEAAPESASAPGCPEVGLGPSSWAVGTPPPQAPVPPSRCAGLPPGTGTWTQIHKWPQDKGTWRGSGADGDSGKTLQWVEGAGARVTTRTRTQPGSVFTWTARADP